jgi:hypothetical protein
MTVQQARYRGKQALSPQNWRVFVRREDAEPTACRATVTLRWGGLRVTDAGSIEQDPAYAAALHPVDCVGRVLLCRPAFELHDHFEYGLIALR